MDNYEEVPIVDHRTCEPGSGGTDVVCVGEALWDLVAPVGTPLEQARLLRRVPGGGAVNTAMALTRLGVASAVCAALGDDALGRGLRDELAAAGVEVDRLAFGAGRTGLMLIALEGGEARFLGYRQRKAEARALAAALPACWRARVVHFSGIAPVRGAIGAIEQAAERARRDGCAVSVDVNARPRMWLRAGRGASTASVRGFLRLLHQADLVKCSVADLAVLGTTASALRAQLRAGATLVVTDGTREARMFGPFGERAVPPRPVRVIDPTGAGDAFCAGMLAALVWQEREAWGDAALVLRAVVRGHEVARTWLRRRRG